MGISFVEKSESMSDAELAVLARGSEDAAAALLKRYTGLIKARASAFYNGAIEMDDLVQEGIIAFYLSIKRYDPSLSSFSTYARACVDKGIISAFRAIARKRHIPPSMIVRLTEYDGISSRRSPEDIIIETEEISSLEENIHHLLSRMEYKVLLLYLHDCPRGEIASQLGTTERAVSNALYRIRSKLKSL